MQSVQILVFYNAPRFSRVPMKVQPLSLRKSRKLENLTVIDGNTDGGSGLVSGGMREDNAPYFTNQDGHPFPDHSHSKTVGGIPVASDTFLFQKQQAFNRHKLLERMVHPCECILEIR